MPAPYLSFDRLIVSPAVDGHDPMGGLIVLGSAQHRVCGSVTGGRAARGRIDPQGVLLFSQQHAP